MINSIQHFQEQGVKNLTEIFSHYTDDLTKFAEMVYGVTKEVTKLGLSLIKEELESYDELLRKRQDLRMFCLRLRLRGCQSPGRVSRVPRLRR